MTAPPAANIIENTITDRIKKPTVLDNTVGSFYYRSILVFLILLSLVKDCVHRNINNVESLTLYNALTVKSEVQSKVCGQ